MFKKYSKPEQDSQDFLNRKRIEEIVDSHFSLEYDSFSYFKSQLWEPEIDATYIAPILGEGTDLRKSVEVEDLSYFERNDEGWRTFKQRFPTFIGRYMVDYEVFRSGKVMVGKNKIKLRKALISYYTKEENLALINADIFGYFNSATYYARSLTEGIIGEITFRIDSCLRDVNDHSITKKGGIKAVISANFADMFLCSTSNGWSSCLSLTSDYEYGYWTGLPGLVGDKNRVMVYITDGEEKNFYHIKTDKVISRTWGILTEEGKIHLLNWYPSSTFCAESLNEIFGEDIFTDDSNEWKSKHPVKLLFNNSGESRFIYQDYSHFSNKKFIKGGESGHGYFSEFGNSSVHYGDIYDIPTSLDRLIGSCETVESYSGIRSVCSDCGEYIDGEEYVVHDNTICEYCYNEYYFSCHQCGREDNIDNGISTEDGEIYCSRCEDDLVECEHDNMMYHYRDCRTFVDSHGNDDLYIYKWNITGDYKTLDNGNICHEEDAIKIGDKWFLYKEAVDNGDAVYCEETKQFIPKDEATYLSDEGKWISTDELERYRDSLQIKMDIGA